MRVTTKIVWDIETGQVLAHEWYDYSGPVALCKGDKTAQAAEKQQMTFDSQLMGLFTKQFGTQEAQLKFLQGVLEPQISAGGTGFGDKELAAMRTSATDTNSQQYQNAQDALNNKISEASGGSKLTGVSGAALESQAALLNAEAQQEAGSQNDITQKNAQLKQQNFWNSVNALNGVAAQVNPLGYANSATSGSGAVAGLSNAVTNSNQSQLMGALGGIAGGVGSALGGGFTKGGLFGCWIFASFFGWHDLRTWVMRVWLHTRAPRWFRNFYMAHGSQIAKTPFRWAFRPIATYVLAVA